MFKNILYFILSLLIVFLVAFIGSSFTTKSIANWYRFLKRPPFAPPNWLFAPAWGLLYLLMAIAAFLIWQQRGAFVVKTALIFYFSQLILNTLWSIIFFGLRKPGLAFIEIIVLWVFILLTLIKFYQINKTAGLLLLPYLLWVTFASVLNLSVWLLNS